jgi:hypothetical protein
MDGHKAGFCPICGKEVFFFLIGGVWLCMNLEVHVNREPQKNYREIKLWVV